MKTRTGYLIKRGRTFFAVWQVNGKKYTKTTKCTTERKARKALALIMEPFLIEDTNKTLESVKASIEKGSQRIAVIEEAKHPPLPLKHAWDKYLLASSRPASGEATLKQYESHYDQFLAWLTKNHPEALAMRDTSRKIASEYASYLLGRGLSGNRFNKHIRFLELIYRVLADEARITDNPWGNPKRDKTGKGITRQPIGKRRTRRELTITELRDICNAATGELRVLFGIGIYTGLRLGDCATLRWGEVDLILNKITRWPNKTKRYDDKPITMNIHPTLRAMFEEIPANIRKEYVLPGIADEYENNPVALTLRIQKHFTDCKVSTHRPGTGIEIRIGKDGKTEKVDTGKRAEVEVGFHSLRHTFVTMLAASNTPLAVTQSLVGHSNPAMTMHYDHPSEAASALAVASLPSMTEEPIKALPPAGSPRLIDADAVLAVIVGSNAKNWKSKLEELRMLVAKPETKTTAP
jgi:integrase